MCASKYRDGSLLEYKSPVNSNWYEQTETPPNSICPFHCANGGLWFYRNAYQCCGYVHGDSKDKKLPVLNQNLLLQFSDDFFKVVPCAMKAGEETNYYFPMQEIGKLYILL